ncbi:MAG: hypothetical protein C4330_08405 [Chitinophagaceae bacterium]
MACNFSLNFNGDPGSVLNKVKSAIEGQGGTFSGDATSGFFSVKVMGTIAGSYSVSGNQIDITITDKPMFIGCGQIESVLKSQLGS